jgi:hypothetical protein
MAYTRPLQEYKRTPQPVLPESQKRWLEEELRKLERVLESVYEALKEIDSRLNALEP